MVSHYNSCDKDSSENSMCKNVNEKQELYCGPTNIRHYSPELSRMGHLVPRICVPLLYVIW